MNESGSNDNIPFCTKLFQVILTGVLIASIISAMQIVTSSDMSAREYMFNFFVYAPLLLSVIIWYKIHNQNLLRMKYSSLRIGQLRISSSYLVYMSVITIICLALAMWDELIAHIPEFKALPEFVSFGMKNAEGYLVSISVLCILSICLSVSLRSKVHAFEVPIMCTFFLQSLSYYLYKLSGEQFLEIGNRESVLLILSFFLYAGSFRNKWNKEREVDIREFYWFTIFIAGFVVSSYFRMLDSLLNSWAILPIPLYLGSEFAKIKDDVFIKAVKASYVQLIAIIVSKQIHPIIEILAFISTVLIIKFIYNTTYKKALKAWIIYILIVAAIAASL